MANKLNRDIESGEVVVIDKKYHNKNYQDLEQRLFIVSAGFGMMAGTMGTAISGKYVADGEECRREGYEINSDETNEYQGKNGKFI
jgi:hypothetical protein